MNYILGIDPGASGALAFYNPKDGHLAVIDMPTKIITKNKKKKVTIDLYQLGSIIDVWKPQVACAYIEQVSAMPGQGVTSCFNFGFAAGAVQAAVAANMIPIHLVTPAVWKRAMGLNSDKGVSRVRATEKFPERSGLWSRVKDDGRAEAALLAHYGANITNFESN